MEELQALRGEYSKLSDQVDSNESKHRKDLDTLTSQVSNYKKTSAESAGAYRGRSSYAPLLYY